MKNSYKIETIILTTLLIQFGLLGISLSKDTVVQKDFGGMVFLVMGWSILAGILTFIFKKKNIFDFVSKFVFFAVSILNIAILSFISVAVLLDGPLKESGLIFIVFPFAGFFVFCGGIVLGVVVFLVKNRLQNKKKDLIV